MAEVLESGPVDSTAKEEAPNQVESQKHEDSKQDAEDLKESEADQAAQQTVAEEKKATAAQPVPTLYVRNLNDKIKLEEMRTNLYMLFSTYGEIVQVRMRATQQLRGQAFVVFKEQMSADRALAEMQNFLIFGSQITLEYARSKSDETRRIHHEAIHQQVLDGLVPQGADKGGTSLQKVINERRRKRQQKAETKRMERREKLLKQEEELRKQTEMQAEVSNAVIKQTEERIAAIEHEKAVLDSKSQQMQKEIAKAEEEAKVSEPAAPKTRATRSSARAAKVQPTNTIQVENLPVNFSRLMLEELTKNYPGVDCIVEADGPGCRAVIRFDSADQAKFAVMGLNRFRVDQSGRELRVNFLKTQAK